MTRSWMMLLPALLITGLPSLGCSGTETGNPPGATASFRLESSDTAHFSVGSSGGGVEITKAQLGVQQLAFTECQSQTVTEVAQAVTVDLRDGTSSFVVPAQPLCVVELSFAPRDIGWSSVDPGASPQLSLGVAGLTNLAAPLFIEDDATPSVVFRPSAFAVTASTKLALSLDIAKALSFQEIEQLAPNGTGQSVISNQENAAVLTNIRQRWASSWSLLAANSSGGFDVIATGAAQ